MDRKGYYNKFDVKRKDGRDQPGGDREGAKYFTLDLTHDPYALVALNAYAEGMIDENPALYQNIMEIIGEHLKPMGIRSVWAGIAEREDGYRFNLGFVLRQYALEKTQTQNRSADVKASQNLG